MSRGRWARSIPPAVAMLLTLAGAAAAQTAQPGGPAAPAALKKRAAQDQWPKQIKMADATVVLDEPQADSVEGAKLTGRGTARIEKEGQAEPAFGMIWYEAEIETDRARRVVTLTSVHVPRVLFIGMPQARQQRVANRVSQAVTRMRPSLPLDDVLAEAKRAGSRDETPPKLNTEPPKIVVKTEPAILVLFDGEPRFRTVEGAKLERALNTPFLVLRDPSAKAYYLNGGTTWFRAPDPTGPWSKSDDVPAAAVQVARRDLREGGVGDKEVEQAKESADKRVPKILVATEPTELIVSDGPPQWSPAVAGEVETLSNSESDVFRTLPDREVFIVISGRWYRSGSFDGPWKYVEPDRIPDSFRKIPVDSPKADALAFVPGTGMAREALADAKKPRTSAVRRSDAKVNVTYDGEPRFEPVPGTHVEYALACREHRVRGKLAQVPFLPRLNHACGWRGLSQLWHG